ncbi:hypothetical protein VTJ04DRAFT_6088 [Mycothermus thermophilus]|uniref:uncharacterized protein n=1 Tax=Humicola insolens TaxID=85995 RepID=UPI003743271B
MNFNDFTNMDDMSGASAPHMNSHLAHAENNLGMDAGWQDPYMDFAFLLNQNNGNVPPDQCIDLPGFPVQAAPENPTTIQANSNIETGSGHPAPLTPESGISDYQVSEDNRAEYDRAESFALTTPSDETTPELGATPESAATPTSTQTQTPMEVEYTPSSSGSGSNYNPDPDSEDEAFLDPEPAPKATRATRTTSKVATRAGVKRTAKKNTAKDMKPYTRSTARLERNRESARRYRERKKHEIEVLKERYEVLRNEMDKMRRMEAAQIDNNIGFYRQLAEAAQRGQQTISIASVMKYLTGGLAASVDGQNTGNI